MERTVVFELDPEAGELSSQRNEDGEANRVKITSREIGRCLVTGKLKGVHYGTFKGQPTALILFKFNFGFRGRPLFRYKSAQIKLTFSSTRPEPDIERLEPVTCGSIPHTVYGEVIKATKVWRREISLTFKTSSLLPVELGIEPTIAHETTFVRGRRMEIHSSLYSDKFHRQDNIVLWNINENPLTKDGIPHEFSCAALVKHHNFEFQTEVELKLSAGLKIVLDPRSWGIVARPWTKDDPIRFDLSIPSELILVPEPEETEFSRLSNDYWRELVASSEEYVVPFICIFTIDVQAHFTL
jgi:hypothetical protein